jgi:hypothetical protein
MHELTKGQARRIAVRAQLLDAPRPSDLIEVVQRLTLLQIDPTAAIAPSADLVLWSRLGSAYGPDDLKRPLEEERTLFELDAMIRPTGDLGLYLAGADERPSYERTRAWLRDNDGFRCDILKRLRNSGPLSSRELPDTAAVPWASSGWSHNRNVTQMLEILMNRGEVAISGRVGRERLWDLPERVYTAGVFVPSVEDAGIFGFVCHMAKTDDDLLKRTEQSQRVLAAGQRVPGLAGDGSDERHPERQIRRQEADVPPRRVGIQQTELEDHRVQRNRPRVVAREQHGPVVGHVLEAAPVHPEVAAVQRPDQRREHPFGQLRVEAERVDVVLAGGAAGREVEDPADGLGLQEPDPLGLRRAETFWNSRSHGLVTVVLWSVPAFLPG